MKNIKQRIALIFSVACAATLLFAIPTFACDNHNHGKHGGVFYPTPTKSWFGSCDGSYQDKRNAEQTLNTEESVQEQPTVEEPVQEESVPVQEKSVDCYKKWETDNQNEYNPWLKSRASITKDNLHASPKLNKSSNRKTKIIKYITPPENFQHSILLMVSKVKIEKDNQQNIIYSLRKAGVGLWRPTDASVNNEEEKMIYIPWYQTRNSINNKRVQRMFIQAWQPTFSDTDESKTIHGLTGWGFSHGPYVANNTHSIPVIGEWLTLIWQQSTNELKTPEIQTMRLWSPCYDLFKLSFEMPIEINFATANVAVTTKPAAQTILQEMEELASHLRLQSREKGKINHDGFANKNTRKNIEFVLLRHRGVSAINANTTKVVIHSAPAIRENISKPQFKKWHGFIGANGITRPAQTTTIYNSNMSIIHICGLETHSPYASKHRLKAVQFIIDSANFNAKTVFVENKHSLPQWVKVFSGVNSNKRFTNEYSKLVPKTPEIQKMGAWSYDWMQKDPKQIYINTLFKNDYKTTTTKPQRVYFDMNRRHEVFRLASVLNNANTTKVGLVKVRLFRPFSSNNTKTNLEPLRLIPGFIIQNETNRPISTMFAQLIRIAKPIQNNEEIQRRGMEYRTREALGRSYLALFPTVNIELHGKTAGMSYTPINRILKTQIGQIWPIAPVITNPIDGRVAHPLHVILRELLIPEEERLETATQIGGGQHQRVALARQLFPYFC